MLLFGIYCNRLMYRAIIYEYFDEGGDKLTKNKRIVAFSVVIIMILTLLACSNSTTKGDITEQESNVSEQESNVSAQESNVSEQESNVSEQESNVSEQESNVSEQESNVSEEESTNISTPIPKSSGVIYLYGEEHGKEKILNKELELWGEHYKQGMRHLFREAPYYSAEFLNIWMQSDSDEILDEIYDDLARTPAHNPYFKDFYKTIKSQYPETIFHGTDVGHQYDTTGERYLEYLRNNNLEDSEQYLLTKDAIRQGKFFYQYDDHTYRENMMTENFIREFDKLDGENVMGIYGAAHTGLDSMDFYNTVPCMANQLKERYDDNVNSEDLSGLAKEIEPLRVDTIKVAGKDYKASYFGIQDLSSLRGYDFREFWRLEDAYDDFKDSPKNGNVLPYDNYPTLIETGQVFVTDVTKTDGSIEREYYRSDGNEWQGLPSTEGFTVE